MSESCGCQEEGKIAPERNEPLSDTAKYPKEPSVASRGGALTRSKFEKYIEKIFKKQINRIKNIRNEHILVCISGGNASTAMLSMLHKWTNLHPNSKKYFTYSVLHIGDKAKFLEYLEKQEGKERVKQVYCVAADKAIQSISETFDKELTSTEETAYQVTYHQLLKIADELGFKSVMMGNSGSRIANRAMVDLCMSRGGGIANLTGAEQGIKLKNGNIIRVFRPMNEMLAREIGFFVRFNRLSTMFVPVLSTGKSLKRATVDRLVETFLCDMQEEFPNTVLTILRTCEKLKPYEMKKEEICSICLNNPILKKDALFCSGCERTMNYSKIGKEEQKLKKQKMDDIINQYVLTPIDDEE